MQSLRPLQQAMRALTHSRRLYHPFRSEWTSSPSGSLVPIVIEQTVSLLTKFAFSTTLKQCRLEENALMIFFHAY